MKCNAMQRNVMPCLAMQQYGMVWSMVLSTALSMALSTVLRMVLRTVLRMVLSAALSMVLSCNAVSCNAT